VISNRGQIERHYRHYHPCNGTSRTLLETADISNMQSCLFTACIVFIWMN